MTASEIERRTIHFTGRVQGVGFRYRTSELAEQFAVTGFVENLPDGRVLLMIEGEASELDRFLTALAQRLARYIDGQETGVSPPTGEFPRFGIRR